MKLLIFFNLILVAFCNHAFSQKIYLGFQSGMGSYSMSDLDRLNDIFMNSLPFDSKLVSDFPPYIYFQPSIMYQFNRASIGIVYNYYSTGSRVSAKDISGEYRFDLTTFAHSPGFCGNYLIWSSRNLEAKISSTLGLTSTVLNLNEYLGLGDTVINNQTIRFNSYNFYFEPGFNIVYNLKKFKIGLCCAYSVHFKNIPFFYEEESNKLTIANDSFRPDWSGYRIGLSISYPLDLFEL